MANRYVIANWKMNLPPEGMDAYMKAIAGGGGASLVIAPPFPYLRQVSELAGNSVAVAAQNCADQEKGAFTGEVSPAMIRDCGARYVILGHSERRTLYGETDGVVARKLALALGNGLTPVLCIGENLKARDAGKAATILADQIRATAPGVVGKGEVILAYEPIWAIGTGRNASGAMVAETVAQIRDALGRFWHERKGADISILYGGSVTPENVGDLVSNGQVDGFLVGGASLDSGKFRAIRAGLG